MMDRSPSTLVGGSVVALLFLALGIWMLVWTREFLEESLKGHARKSFFPLSPLTIAIYRSQISQWMAKLLGTLCICVALFMLVAVVFNYNLLTGKFFVPRNTETHLRSP